MADGATVAVSTGATGGFPTPATTGIGAAMACESATLCQGMTLALAAGANTWTPSGGSATCHANYDEATGAVTTVTTGC